MSVAEVNGQRISYADTGGDGRAVLFSHGFLLDGSMFDAQVEALRDTFRCVTWDARGHGGTPALAPFTYWDLADDTLALLTFLGIEEAVFAGMSQGGFLSLRAALRAPTRVRALILIDTQCGLEDPEAVPLYVAMHDEWVAHGPEAVQETVASLVLGGDVDAERVVRQMGCLGPVRLQHPVPCPDRPGRPDRSVGRRCTAHADHPRDR